MRPKILYKQVAHYVLRSGFQWVVGCRTLDGRECLSEDPLVFSGATRYVTLLPDLSDFFTFCCLHDQAMKPGQEELKEVIQTHLGDMIR